jgi:hypothetical protein
MNRRTQAVGWVERSETHRFSSTISSIEAGKSGSSSTEIMCSAAP